MIYLMLNFMSIEVMGIGIRKRGNKEINQYMLLVTVPTTFSFSFCNPHSQWIYCPREIVALKFPEISVSISIKVIIDYLIANQVVSLFLILTLFITLSTFLRQFLSV